VNISAMRLKNCIDVIGTVENVTQDFNTIPSATPEDMLTRPFACNVRHYEENSALSEAIGAIKKCTNPPEETYFDIVKLLLENGAWVDDALLARLCSTPRHSRTRLLTIFLPHVDDKSTIYLPDVEVGRGRLLFYLTQEILKKINTQQNDNNKMVDLTSLMADLKWLLSHKKKLHPCILEVLGIIELLGIIEGLDWLVGNLHLYHVIMKLFRVLLSYEHWEGNPGAIVVPKEWCTKNMFTYNQIHTMDMTLVDIFYVMFDRWSKPCQDLYLEVLHPVIQKLQTSSNDSSYLHSILKEEVNWRDGGFTRIKWLQESFLMEYYKDKNRFLKEELDRVCFQKNGRDVRRFFFPTPCERMRVKRAKHVRKAGDDDKRPILHTAVSQPEFNVRFKESEQRREQRKKIQDVEERFRNVRRKFATSNNWEWYDLFGDLFLCPIINWKENTLLKEFFTTHITTRSFYGIKDNNKQT
jgi:hypothetical protein